MPGINKGGTQEIDGDPLHADERLPLLELRRRRRTSASRAGSSIRFDGKSIYFAGDTCVFGDMQLIARLYKPDVAVLPIGDWFTMGPEEAALALELLGNPRCVPCHWGTFGAADRHAGRARGADERDGRADRAGRHRSSCEGARGSARPGRRVPEIALDGELDLDDALVLDALDDEALRAAHAEGRPGRRARATAAEVKAALARPEVAVALVTDRRCSTST